MRLLLSLALLLLASVATAQPVTDSSAAADESGRFSLRGYGSANYFAFDWDTDPARRNAIDLERLVLYPSVRLSDRIGVDAELEIEHGGTGAALEFDVLEEFGEFEQEIEKGGEVVLEQLHVRFNVRPWLAVRVGRVKVPFGITARNDEPTEYFTTTRSETESALVPTNWYENGVQAAGAFGTEGRFSYALSLVNGLDATGFSSASWVVRGQQTRFETVNADALALALRLDYNWPGGFAGVSAYAGNSAPNRPKPDLSADAWVAVADVHASIETGPLTLRALVLGGALQNADLVTQANRNLSNNLGVVRTPVGSTAGGVSVEAGYDVLTLAAPASGQRLDVFARLDRYDTMASVTGAVFDNPRWSRTAFTGGLNWKPIPAVVLKAQAQHRRLGTGTENVENTLSLGVGFEF